MISHESLPLELYESSYADYMESKSGSEEVTYAELQPLQTYNLPDLSYNDKENDMTYSNPLLPVYVESQDRPVVITSYFSLSSLQDDGFVAKMASIDKPSCNPKPQYLNFNDSPRDINSNSNEYSSNEYSFIPEYSSKEYSTKSDSHSSIDYNDLPEVNTKDIAERVLKELRRHNIAQHVFARKILHRSQGTLSDLLRNPKPWSKMKNGRETFHKLLLWLQHDEEERIKMLCDQTK